MRPGAAHLYYFITVMNIQPFPTSESLLNSIIQEHLPINLLIAAENICTENKSKVIKYTV